MPACPWGAAGGRHQGWGENGRQTPTGSPEGPRPAAPGPRDRPLRSAPRRESPPAYSPSTQAKRRGATIVASLSMMNLGVSAASLPQVIFSLGTAPE